MPPEIYRGITREARDPQADGGTGPMPRVQVVLQVHAVLWLLPSLPSSEISPVTHFPKGSAGSKREAVGFTTLLLGDRAWISFWETLLLSNLSTDPRQQCCQGRQHMSIWSWLPTDNGAGVSIMLLKSCCLKRKITYVIT